MKLVENKLLNYINKKSGLDLVLTRDEFSTFDASNKDYIVEFKTANKVYETALIEVSKLHNLLQVSSKFKKQALYVMADSTGVYIFNLTKLEKEIIKEPIENRFCPYRTEFKENIKIKKYLYFLNKQKATKL